MSVSLAAHTSSNSWQLSGSVTTVEQGPIQKKHVSGVHYGSTTMPSVQGHNFASTTHENLLCRPGPGTLTFVRPSDHLSSEIQTALSSRRRIQKMILSLPNGVVTLTGVYVAALKKDAFDHQGGGRRAHEELRLTFQEMQWLRHR